ncbi:hypothetical protein HYPSUDRAFT_960248 [Hypholoma sublateritium FD-334 SS-4]|uniref:F-box domain-containing protein n=1 Tax=Hypholoma sublateritium (strain FD-334 SS-4) TaxID=945553 RepID=A0A0D2PDL0_HYPSF|nr:hypothetical protein HYPSUDRAFT_960248 [Hypholoma sublateritium FD-334 SS-4]
MNYSDSERLNYWLNKAKRNSSSFWTAVTSRTRKTSEKSMVEKSSLRRMIRHSISFDLRLSNRLWSTTRRSLNHEDTLNNYGGSSATRHQHPLTTKFRCAQILMPARIPSEILGLIFLYATEEHKAGGHYSFPAVSQVSRSWRAASLSISTLWNNITLDCQQPAFKSKSYSSIVELLVRRTCGAPLNVSIKLLLPIKLVALDVLLGTSDRWEVASIELSPESVTSFSAIRDRLSSLRRLELMLIGRPVTNKKQYDVFERAPRLQEALIQVSG